MKEYKAFLKKLDARLAIYFEEQAEHIYCKKGCSACCEKGDYPISEIELRYIMLGYSKIDNDLKIQIQSNLSNIKKGDKCPFLINKECSIYTHRPIICRTHGLAYLCNNKIAKVPYCVNNGLNYKNVYQQNELSIEPINENLDTQYLLKDLEYGEIRNLYDWIIQ